jgi:hypothetical protein
VLGYLEPGTGIFGTSSGICKYIGQTIGTSGSRYRDIEDHIRGYWGRGNILDPVIDILESRYGGSGIRYRGIFSSRYTDI